MARRHGDRCARRRLAAEHALAALRDRHADRLFCGTVGRLRYGDRVACELAHVARASVEFRLGTGIHVKRAPAARRDASAPAPAGRSGRRRRPRAGGRVAIRILARFGRGRRVRIRRRAGRRSDRFAPLYPHRCSDDDRRGHRWLRHRLRPQRPPGAARWRRFAYRHRIHRCRALRRRSPRPCRSASLSHPRADRDRSRVCVFDPVPLYRA